VTWVSPCNPMARLGISPDAHLINVREDDA
jgi:hypothetical protein